MTAEPIAVSKADGDKITGGTLNQTGSFVIDAIGESAGVTLVRGDLRGMAAVNLSHKTTLNIRQNLFSAFFSNAIGIPLAAGPFYAGLGLLLSPMVAAAAMSLSSVSIIGNALRLRSVTRT